ncbi:MAG: hypothetical protein QOD93_3599 [Acetobacteraceae bacterium]|jgi:DNA-binding transcriptional LysR family regulator|nr:hypothetical protein [Acetobacteraceae bacterium]
MNLIDDIHIRRLDLTLLIVFEMLLKKRSMSAVAAEMGLTQSAVSHAVGRLRSVFGDPLFVRKRAGVAPTVRCSWALPWQTPLLAYAVRSRSAGSLTPEPLRVALPSPRRTPWSQRSPRPSWPNWLRQHPIA